MKYNPQCENKILFKGEKRKYTCGNKGIKKCNKCDKWLCEKCSVVRKRHICTGPFDIKNLVNYVLENNCPFCHKQKLLPIHQHIDYSVIAYCLSCRDITFIQE